MAYSSGSGKRKKTSTHPYLTAHLGSKAHREKLRAEGHSVSVPESGKTGQQLKKEGLAQVEGNNLEWLEQMRDEAMRICLAQGWVSADCLRPLADRLPEPSSPNVWGSIFKSNDWEPVGYTTSDVASNHSRQIRRWRWTGGFSVNSESGIATPELTPEEAAVLGLSVPDLSSEPDHEGALEDSLSQTRRDMEASLKDDLLHQAIRLLEHPDAPNGSRELAADIRKALGIN